MLLNNAIDFTEVVFRVFQIPTVMVCLQLLKSASDGFPASLQSVAGLIRRVIMAKGY